MSARSLTSGLVDSMGNPLTGGGVTPFIPDPEGLIAYYRMEDAFGAAGNVVDATGLAYTLVSDVRTSSVAGQVGNAGTFVPDGVNAARAIVGPITTNSVFKQRLGYQALSGSFWFRVNTAPSALRIVDVFTASGGSWTLTIRANPEATNIQLAVFIIRNGVAAVSQSVTAVSGYSVGTWYHMAFSYNPLLASNNRVYYRDGAVLNTGTSVAVFGTRMPADVTSNYFIATGTSGDHSVSIDEVGIWNRALTASQVSFLYNGGAGRAYSEITF